LGRCDFAALGSTSLHRDLAICDANSRLRDQLEASSIDARFWTLKKIKSAAFYLGNMRMSYVHFCRPIALPCAQGAKLVALGRSDESTNGW
jgi:hypothetical protein